MNARQVKEPVVVIVQEWVSHVYLEEGGSCARAATFIAACVLYIRVVCSLGTNISLAR